MFMCDKGSDCVDCNWKFANTLSELNDKVIDCPHLIEVSPVIHAHWAEDKKCNCFRCSHCGNKPLRNRYIDVPGFGDYCSYCGAKMDEEVT